MLRGVSGGERKRVTTGEMEFGMKYMTLMDEIKFQQSFVENVVSVTRRQLLVAMRNKSFIRVRGFMVIVIALLYGSLFYQLEPTNVQVTMGVLFQSLFFLGLGQYAQVPGYCSIRGVFYKQRRANHVRTSAYVLACSASQIPWALGETVVFGTIVYWMCGFVATAENFLLYELLVFQTLMAFAAWYFFMAAVTPDIHVAKPVSMMSIFTFVAFAGFVIPKNQIPDYFVWIYWLDPIAWCLRAVAVNQYHSPAFDVCEYAGINYCTEHRMKMGEYFLTLYDVPSDERWVWLGVVVLFAIYASFMVLGWAALEYKRYESPEHITLTTEMEEPIATDEYALATTPSNGRKTPAMGAQFNDTVAVNVRTPTKKFEPVVIAFQDLWYSVPDPHNPKESLTLLKGINGYAMPGSITALMGSTGAGKTTLMDVIAGRKTGGTIQGKILLNGYEASDLAIRRCTGYCEQMDIHSDASTIREALVFSAFLRQDSSVPDSQKYDSVEECLELLDLQSVADEIVRGSPTERMKRLTIGVELAADPRVLFLDEPTSGLDARSAKLIMDGVRKVADTGRTIVCTIHQPSTEVFMLFDKLLLLKRGGQTVYFGDLGERAQTMVDYFEAIPGVTPLAKGYNPATWMLECIGAGVSHVHDNSVDFAEIFLSSDMKLEMDLQLKLEGVAVPVPGSTEVAFGKKRAASSWTQMKALVGRFMALYWRTPSTNLTRLAIMPLMGLLFGLVYVGTDYTSYQGINAGVGMVFLTSYFTGVVSFNSALPITSEDRPAFYREREAQTYSAFWYFVGATVVEIPYVFFSMLLYTVIFYWMVGFSGFGTAVLYWINTSLMVLLQTYMGQLLIYSLSSIDVAALVGVMVYSITILFYGFNPPAADIPAGYQWLYTICPQRYSVAILVGLVFSDCEVLPTYDSETGEYVNVGSSIGCQPMANPPTSIDHMTVKEYVETTFEYKHGEIWRNFGIVLVFIVGIRLLSLLSLRFINHQKK
eukprot:jgi/Phyca11/531416/estExt2_fgenesh1_pm.C_PHYCAscaffold_3330001